MGILKILTPLNPNGMMKLKKDKKKKNGYNKLRVFKI
jgi:hypothetical protein